MKKHIYIFIFLFLVSALEAQVLFTTNKALGTIPHPSAVLEISDSNKGLLLPRVPLLNSTDNSTVPTPVNGLLVFNNTDQKFNFWESGVWNKNFELEDALEYVAQTSNLSANSTTKTVAPGFPANNTTFNFESGTTGWIDLNVSIDVHPTKTTNSVFISGEGMAQLNNETQSNSFAFAIGLFVDGKLKIVRKFGYDEPTSCSWRKFNVSGIFFNITPNTNHQVKLYAYNLPVSNTTGGGYGTSLTYGGGAGSCVNLNEDIARINLTAQITE